MGKKPTKAYLVKQLRKKGITIPKDSTAATLQHRLDNYLPGDGFLVRLAKPPTRKPGHPVTLLTDREAVYWLPNSVMAEQIIKSRLVFVLGRASKPPNNTTPIEVPSDYDKVFGDGSNDSADS